MITIGPGASECKLVRRFIWTQPGDSLARRWTGQQQRRQQQRWRWRRRRRRRRRPWACTVRWQHVARDSQEQQPQNRTAGPSASGHSLRRSVAGAAACCLPCGPPLRDGPRASPPGHVRQMHRGAQGAISIGERAAIVCGSLVAGHAEQPLLMPMYQARLAGMADRGQGRRNSWVYISSKVETRNPGLARPGEPIRQSLGRCRG